MSNPTGHATPPMPPADSPGARRTGWSTILQGALFVAAGFAGLWISFRFADGARAILGAGPLIGGGMIGYGAVQVLLGDRLTWFRWIAAVLSGLLILGATIVLLEETLGVTFA